MSYNHPMENLWILLALASAFSIATSDAFTKKALLVYDEYTIAWLRLLLALPLIALPLLFVPLPSLDRVFYATFLAALPLEVSAFMLYIKALKVSPLNLTLPFLSLTPVFLVIMPYLLLGEKISLAGGIGILFIAAGGYTLNIKDFRKGFMGPFIAIARERGSLYMILVALIYSVSATLAKKVIEHSSAFFAAFVYYAALCAIFTLLVFHKNKGNKGETRLRAGALKAAILPGITDSVAMISGMMALRLTKVAYMISVKRLSLLIGVFYGHLLFREPELRERMLGAALMLTGFALIVLYH